MHLCLADGGQKLRYTFVKFFFFFPKKLCELKMGKLLHNLLELVPLGIGSEWTCETGIQ